MAIGRPAAPAAETVIRVVAEPDSLIPHVSSRTKTVDGTISVGDQRRSVHQVDTTESTYRYPTEPWSPGPS